MIVFHGPIDNPIASIRFMLALCPGQDAASHQSGSDERPEFDYGSVMTNAVIVIPDMVRKIQSDFEHDPFIRVGAYGSVSSADVRDHNLDIRVGDLSGSIPSIMENLLLEMEARSRL